MYLQVNLKIQQAITQLRNKNVLSVFFHQKDPNRVFHISENKENRNFYPLPPLWPYRAIYVSQLFYLIYIDEIY